MFALRWELMELMEQLVVDSRCSQEQLLVILLFRQLLLQVTGSIQQRQLQDLLCWLRDIVLPAIVVNITSFQGEH